MSKPTLLDVAEKFGIDVEYLYRHALEGELTKEDIILAKELYNENPEDLDVLSAIAGWNADNTIGAADWLLIDVDEEFADFDM